MHLADQIAYKMSAVQLCDCCHEKLSVFLDMYYIV
jgi:hypothetical protein